MALWRDAPGPIWRDDLDAAWNDGAPGDALIVARSLIHAAPVLALAAPAVAVPALDVKTRPVALLALGAVPVQTVGVDAIEAVEQ